MEITTPSLTNDAVVAVAAKSPPDQPDPKRTNTKSLSFTNGVLKRHHIVGSTPPPSSSVDVVVVEYKECLKNHAAALGGHALDGCGEFMPDRSVSSNPNLSISFKCVVCGCHRNFHRREPEDSSTALHLLTPPPNPAIEYHPHHRHRHPPLPLTSPSPPSPPPISSSYYQTSAPHMLIALSTGLPPPENTQNHTVAVNQVSGSGRKRFRTKFSSLQKEKMHEVAEKVGWKMQKKDEEIVNELCNRIGVGREVFKVWMHNNKTTFNFNNNKPSLHSAEGTGNAGNNMFFSNGDGLDIHHDTGEFNTAEDHSLPDHSLPVHSNLNAANGSGIDMIQHHHRHGHVTTNGSVSSP